MEQWQKERENRWLYLRSVKNKTYFTEVEVDTLIRFAVLEKDLSANSYFLKPLQTHVSRSKINEKVMHYYHKGNFVEKAGALKLLYFIYPPAKELEKRNILLLEDFLDCQHPILCFFYKWALPHERFKKYFEGEPDGSEELFNAIKDNPEYLEQFYELFPHARLQDMGD